MTDCCRIELAFWWIIVACLLIKSEILNHQYRSEKCDFYALMMMMMMMMMSTDFHENASDMIRAKAVETEVAAYLADSDRSL